MLRVKVSPKCSEHYHVCPPLTVRPPRIHHAWTPCKFLLIFSTALKRQANPGLSCAPKSSYEHTFGNVQEWYAPQQRAPVVHHAWTPGMFWSNLCTALPRGANSALGSAAKALDEHKLGNVHGAGTTHMFLNHKKRP